MRSKKKPQNQLHFLAPTLTEQLNPNHPLYLLAHEIDWTYSGDFARELELFKKVLAQQKDSKRKIYSLHEPQVYCMSKGKAHKKYEYGCKASVVLTQKTGIIVGAMTFKTNVYDGHTLKEVIQQATALTDKAPKTATVGRGYQGKPLPGLTSKN